MNITDRHSPYVKPYTSAIRSRDGTRLIFKCIASVRLRSQMTQFGHRLCRRSRSRRLPAPPDRVAHSHTAHAVAHRLGRSVSIEASSVSTSTIVTAAHVGTGCPTIPSPNRTQHDTDSLQSRTPTRGATPAQPPDRSPFTGRSRQPSLLRKRRRRLSHTRTHGSRGSANPIPGAK